MTYEEQLKVEELNKQIINNIVNTVKPDDFINYYLQHNQKETCEHFGLRTTKQLTKVLKLFNYDFSKPKPSKFKGKAAARSHDSYLTGGQKSSETQKQNWVNKSDDDKMAWSNKQKAAHSSDEFKQAIKQINLDYQANLTAEQKEKNRLKKSLANKQTWDINKQQILDKAYRTKSINNSWNSSKPEDNYYAHLLTIFNESDIIRQYTEDRYPHNCDFYIKPLDLFIELNFSWTHGEHKFNPNSEIDIKKLSIWQTKATTSKYYQKAIETWTILDLKKFEDATKNNLNYLVFYTEEEAINYEF